MKEFRKDHQKNFICEECEKIFLYKKTLSYHINKQHGGIKKYYEKWLRNEDDVCIICKKQTGIISFKKGCCKCCSKKCTNKLRENTCLKMYGVTHVSKSEQAKQHSKKTCQEKYGVDNPWQAKEIKEKCKQTCLRQYGVEYSLQNLEIRKKGKETCKKLYGVECSLQNLEIRKKGKETKKKLYGDENYCNKEKYKQTCLKRYDVENPSQNINILNKGFKTRFLIHHYLDTNLTYQGSYELHFLDTYYEKICIENGLSFKYKTKDNKNKVYHSDFYIPSKNLIIEIKNSYLAERDKKEIKAKKNAVLNEGYKFIIIVDKNYKKINKLFT